MKTIKTRKEKVVNNYIDSKTGELIDQSIERKHHTIVIDDKETFYWTYLAVEALLEDIDKVQFKVLFYCMLNCQWNKNLIILNKTVLQDIEKKVGLKYQTVRNAISKLKKRGVFIELGSATYRINPRYYWRGTSEERLRTMNYILEIECPNC